MANKKILKPTTSTRQLILAASGNQCAFPGCNEMIVDLEHQVLVGEIAHIKGEKPEAARYDIKQTPEERCHFSNLVALCRKHHTIVDKSEDRYNVKKLIEMKLGHEARMAKASDRGWIVPPNQTHFCDKDGTSISVYWWKDRNGRQRIYSNEQRAIVDTLLKLYLDLDTLAKFLETVPTIKDPIIDSILQQSWAKLDHGEWSPFAHIIRLMAMTPDITFAEFLRFLLQGKDPTSLIEEMAKHLSELAKERPGKVVSNKNKSA